MAISPEQLSPVGKKFFNRVEFDADEVLIREVRKDPFGLFLIYVGGAVATLVIFGLMVLGPSSYSLGSFGDILGLTEDSLAAIIVALGFFMTVFSVALTAVAAFLYVNNVILVTSEKVCQQLYLSLFNKKISQLSIADVQDVTVKQQGIWAHLFNYGTLTVETAGEQSNYTFTFVPEPYNVSKDLVGSHEADVALHGN